MRASGSPTASSPESMAPIVSKMTPRTPVCVRMREMAEKYSTIGKTLKANVLIIVSPKMKVAPTLAWLYNSFTLQQSCWVTQTAGVRSWRTPIQNWSMRARSTVLHLIDLRSFEARKPRM